MGSKTLGGFAPDTCQAWLPGFRIRISRRRGDWAKDAGANCKAHRLTAGRSVMPNQALQPTPGDRRGPSEAQGRAWLSLVRSAAQM
jgi:hypothetical protein